MFKAASNFWKYKRDIAEVSWSNDSALHVKRWGHWVLQRWTVEQSEGKGCSKIVTAGPVGP